MDLTSSGATQFVHGVALEEASRMVRVSLTARTVASILSG